MQLDEVVGRQHLHGLGHGPSYALKIVVEDSTAQWHEVHLDGATPRGAVIMLHCFAQRAVVLRLQDPVGDELERRLMLLLCWPIGVCINRNCRRVDEVHSVRTRAQRAFPRVEACRRHIAHS